MNDISGFLKAQLLVSDRENVVYNMIILAILEMMTGFVRKIYENVSKYLNTYIEKKMNNVEIKINQVTKSENVLYFERDWKNSGDWDRADSLLHHILKIPESQAFLVIANIEIIKNGTAFFIDKDIQFQMTELNIRDGIVDSIKFKIFSEKVNVCELRNFVDDTLQRYIIEKKNNLGNKLYYFDHIVQDPKRGDYVHKLLFTQHPFTTNRTLENVFHEKQEELKTRVKFFLGNKEWYDERGIPHTLGLMFHGIPGSGKTSSVKAIANIAQRHIININLGSIKFQKQLKKLFYDEKITVCDPDTPNRVTELIIPIEKRMYVIEDADALIDSDILKKREDINTTKLIERGGGGRMGPSGMQIDEPDIDLSTILNIMDGNLETPGRILIITSNHPECFDSAFIRPGRIDMMIEFKRANKKVISDMYKSFFEKDIDSTELEKIEDYKWSPAEIGQLLFKNFDFPEKAVKDLIELGRSYFDLEKK